MHGQLFLLKFDNMKFFHSYDFDLFFHRDLSRQALSPQWVRVKLLIQLGRNIYEYYVRHKKSIPETGGGVSIWGLW